MAKSIITPIAQQVTQPIAQQVAQIYLNFSQFGENLSYPYLGAGNSTKILGLHITSRSFTVNHVLKLNTKANALVSLIICLRELPIKAKIHLVKALIISSLTYPDTILLTCSPSGFYNLQKPLNRALKWVQGVYYPEVVTARELHVRSKIQPLNQIIYHRGRKMWDKILDGTAADQDYANTLVNNDNYTKPHTWYPSSYGRSRLPEPPPIYTSDDISTRAVKDYYGHDQD